MNTTHHPPLKLDSLTQAVTSLRDALAKPKNPHMRDVTIRRFEHALTLSWMALRRHLSTQTGVDTFDLNDLFRQAGKQSIIANVEAWLAYLKGYSRMSRTCDEKTAEESYQLAAAFLPDAQALLHELNRRYGAPGR